jgi:hypothetical protein
MGRSLLFGFRLSRLAKVSDSCYKYEQYQILSTGKHENSHEKGRQVKGDRKCLK